MNNRLRRAFILTLSLLLCALPFCSLAEEALPSADHLNMTTVSVSNIRYDDGSGETMLPLTVEMSFGADLPKRRALALLSLHAGEAPFTVMGSMESEELRARFSGMDALLTASLPRAEDELIQSVLLLGLKYEDCSEETLAALDEYLALLEESMAVPAKVVESSNIIEAMYPADGWREEYEKYPSLMNAVPAGEEEITLFGKVYTAKKYTYSLKNASEEEHSAFYESYESFYHGAAGELELAYNKLMELVYADHTASETSSVWKDDGSIGESENGSLSEWSEAEQDGFLFSIEGVIWQVDEVMGTLEEYTASYIDSYGEYTTEYSYSDMLTDGCVRYESTQTETDSYCTVSTTDSMTIQTDETGRILMEGANMTGARYPGEDYVSSSRTGWRSEMTEDRLLLSMNETLSDSYGSDQVINMTADFALGQEEETGLINRASGAMEFEISLPGERLFAAADLNILLSTLPEGTLLPVTGDSIDLFEADEETLSRLTADLESLLIKALGSLIPAPETPSNVGGALLG